MKNLSALPRADRIIKILNIGRDALKVLEHLKSSSILTRYTSITPKDAEEVLSKDVSELLSSVAKVSDLIKISFETNNALFKQLEKTLKSFPEKRIIVIAPSFCLDTIAGKLNMKYFSFTEYKTDGNKSNL